VDNNPRKTTFSVDNLEDNPRRTTWRTNSEDNLSEDNPKKTTFFSGGCFRLPTGSCPLRGCPPKRLSSGGCPSYPLRSPRLFSGVVFQVVIREGCHPGIVLQAALRLSSTFSFEKVVLQWLPSKKFSSGVVC
jgi:hypothetical protein